MPENNTDSIGKNADAEKDGDGIEVPTGAVLTLLPDEQPHCKALRRVVDGVFLCRDQFIRNSSRYTNMVAGKEGVNRYLRSMLFVPSRQLKRGAKRAEVVSATPLDDEGASSAVKQTQRKSKQKERCENRLMSLLFATIYDPATKRCRLVQGAPPLQLRRPDKNGLYRNVSNYTDVRLFLRNSMSAILAAYTDAVKILERMLPSAYRTLPTMYMLIARTFMLILCFSQRSVGASGNVRNFASMILESCFDAIQEYITTWERRNFTTDNPLTNCLKAGKGNECYQAIYSLLKAMIDVLSPDGTEPFSSEFRQHNIYSFGLRWGAKCHISDEDGHQCLLKANCPRKGSKGEGYGDISNASQVCVEALADCAKMALTIDGDEIEAELNLPYFPTAAFQSACDSAVVHRLQETLSWMSSVVLCQQGENVRDQNDMMKTLEVHFVQSTRFDVAQCWAALGRANVPAARILRGLDIKDPSDLNATVVELVFGGGLAAMALFEREQEIIPICHNIGGKRSLNILAMNHSTEEIADKMQECDHVRTEGVETHVNEDETAQESRVAVNYSREVCENVPQDGNTPVHDVVANQIRAESSDSPRLHATSHESEGVKMTARELSNEGESDNTPDRGRNRQNEAIEKVDYAGTPVLTDGVSKKRLKLKKPLRKAMKPMGSSRRKKRRCTIDQTIEAAKTVQEPSSRPKKLRKARK